MQIGMATTVPVTDEQKAEMKKLAQTLQDASDQARRVTDSFGRASAAVTVGGQDLEATLQCLSEQVRMVVERVEVSVLVPVDK